MGLVVAGFNGLFLFTLGVTYYFQVMTALIHKRRLALVINTMLEESAIPENRASDAGALLDKLQRLDLQLAEISQSYLAYPVIHYCYDAAARVSMPNALWRLSNLDRGPGSQTEKTQGLVRVIVTNALLGNRPSRKKRSQIEALIQQSREGESYEASAGLMTIDPATGGSAVTSETKP